LRAARICAILAPAVRDGGGKTPLARARSLFRVAFLCRLAGCVLAVAHAQETPPPRQIAPERFAPTPRDAATISAPHPIAPARSTPAPHETAAPPTRSPIVAPNRERPFGACERTAQNWLVCLEATAQLSDRAVADAGARLRLGLDRRPRLNPVMREAIAKALTGADEAWRSLRERECGELTLIERDLTGSLFEARLVCRIRRNLERVEVLSERYGGEP